MATPDYWHNLTFDYLTAYSLLRGAKWEQQVAALRREKESSRKLLLTATTAELPALRAQLRRLEQHNGLVTRLTTDDKQAYNITATPVATLTAGSPEVVELGRILQTSCQEPLQPMCAPVFRDALAFYNAGHSLLGVLNICFSCHVIQTENGETIEANDTVYPRLQLWFQRLGSQV